MPEKAKIKIIARNRKAWFTYEITEKFEAGLILKGSEVKSMRDGKATLHEAFARLRDGAFWVVGMDVALYSHAGPLNNHEPRRARKLLLHNREIRKLAAKTREKGLTLIPLSLYFKRGLAKLEVGLARGKRKFDKRDKIKARDAGKAMRKSMMKR